MEVRKATYENLHEIGFYKEKAMDLMKFGEEAWFFKREWTQLVQNFACELSKDELVSSHEENLWYTVNFLLMK